MKSAYLKFSSNFLHLSSLINYKFPLKNYKLLKMVKILPALGLFYKSFHSRNQLYCEEEKDCENDLIRNFEDYKTCREKYKKKLALNEGEKNEIDNIPFIKTILSNMDEFMDKYFEDVEISITRNLKHYPSTCQITSEERKELKHFIIDKIIEVEKKVFFSKQNEEILIIKGDFNEINKKFSDYPDKNIKLKNHGVFRDWPEDRFVYRNKSIGVLVNEKDHINYKFKFSINNLNADSTKVGLANELLEFFDFVDNLDKIIQVRSNEEFGYLTTDIKESGNSWKFLVKLKPNPLRNDSLYDKLKSLVNDKSKSYSVFYEKYTDDTNINRENQNESSENKLNQIKYNKSNEIYTENNQNLNKINEDSIDFKEFVIGINNTSSWASFSTLVLELINLREIL